MDFNQNKDALNQELERFIRLLGELIPRYSELLKKKDLNQEELSELGEMEYFLIEVNSKISVIKDTIEQNLFGLSLDIYYKLKAKAVSGDISAGVKLERMREIFKESLENGTIINHN